MEAARATWTDSRLDDLNERVKAMDGNAALLGVLAALIGTIVTLLLTRF